MPVGVYPGLVPGGMKEFRVHHVEKVGEDDVFLQLAEFGAGGSALHVAGVYRIDQLQSHEKIKLVLAVGLQHDGLDFKKIDPLGQYSGVNLATEGLSPDQPHERVVGIFTLFDPIGNLRDIAKVDAADLAGKNVVEPLMNRKSVEPV